MVVHLFSLFLYHFVFFFQTVLLVSLMPQIVSIAHNCLPRLCFHHVVVLLWLILPSLVLYFIVAIYDFLHLDFHTLHFASFCLCISLIYSFLTFPSLRILEFSIFLSIPLLTIVFLAILHVLWILHWHLFPLVFLLLPFWLVSLQGLLVVFMLLLYTQYWKRSYSMRLLLSFLHTNPLKFLFLFTQVPV